MRPERNVWAMLGRQGLPEALPGHPGLRGKDREVEGRGRKKETNKLLFPAAALGARPHQALVGADGAKDSPWVNAFQGVSFVKSAH